MSSSEPKIAALSQGLLAVHRGEPAFDAPAQPLSRAEALAVQTRIMADLGPVAGFKVGGRPGDVPVLAPLPASLVVADGGGRAVPDLLGVELELAFEVIAPLPEGGALPADLPAHFRPCVVLELVRSRLAGPMAEDPMHKMADLQMNAGLVIGSGLPQSGPGAWDGADFGMIEARLMAGAETVVDGAVSVPGGSALAQLAALVAHVDGHCGGLQPGHVVLTGSVCGLPYFPAGTQMRGEIAGLGSVAVDLV